MQTEYQREFGILQEEYNYHGQTWFGGRKELVEEYSWAVPTGEVIEYITSSFDSIVEVGAGNGYWAYCIESAGASVSAYDIDPPEELWTEVRQADVGRMKRDLFRGPVLMVWPPYDSRMSYKTIRQKPPHILYVGEQKGGCTGCDEFFERLDEQYGLVEEIEIPSYIGVHDNFYHFVRNV